MWKSPLLLGAALSAALLTSACAPTPSTNQPLPEPTPVARTAPSGVAIATSGEARSSSYQLSLTVGGGQKASSAAHTLTPR